MSEAEEGGGERSFEPTQRRLDDARQRGEIPRSADLVTAAAYLGLWGAVALFGTGALMALGEALMALLAQAGPLADATFAGDGRPLWAGLLGRTAAAVWPLVALPAALVLLVSMGQGLVVAPERIKPAWRKVDPLAGIGRRFGKAGLGEFGLALLRLAVMGGAASVALVRAAPVLLGLTGQAAGPAVAAMLGQTLDLLRWVALAALVLGLADLLWQRLSFLWKHMMTRRELLDEMKESEGDPHVKGQRRARAVAIATNRMLSDVAKADVVIVNPTHYAVALRWDKATGRAPRCVAKGTDEVARRIRERAMEAGVPIHRDPPTARALHAGLEIGDEVARADWRAVAAAIRFAERLRRRAKERGGAR